MLRRFFFTTLLAPVFAKLKALVKPAPTQFTYSLMWDWYAYGKAPNGEFAFTLKEIWYNLDGDENNWIRYEPWTSILVDEIDQIEVDYMKDCKRIRVIYFLGGEKYYFYSGELNMV